MNIQYIYLSILSFGRSMIKVHIIRMLKNYSCEIHLKYVKSGGEYLIVILGASVNTTSDQG